MTIKRKLWYLPRPSKSKYKGSFPLHFEKKLFQLYDNPKLILQPFSGKTEYGIKVDINPEANPDVIADAHQLPFKSNIFDFVLCDPPYNNELSKKLYGTGRIYRSKYIAEAIRVTKPGGYIVLYHQVLLPRPEGTTSESIIVILTRTNHLARICRVFRKNI